MTQPTKSLGPAEKLKRLEGGSATQDGASISFDVVTVDEARHPFWMATKDVEPFIRYLIDLAQLGNRVGGSLKLPGAGNEPAQVAPIETVALAVSPGRANTECILTAHLGAFHLSFAIDAKAVHGLKAAIDRLQPIGVKPQ